MKWKTQYNAVPSKGEVNTLMSLAKKGQALTVLEILERHKRGIPTNLSAGMPVYYGDQFEFPIWQKMDIVERQDYLAKFKADVKDAKTRWVEQEKQRKAEMADAAEKEFNQRLAKAQAQNSQQSASGSSAGPQA